MLSGELRTFIIRPGSWIPPSLSERFSLCAVSVWIELRGAVRGQYDALLIHAFGLRAEDEAEEVFVWYSGASLWGRGRGAPLVIQPGALDKKCIILVTF